MKSVQFLLFGGALALSGCGSVPMNTVVSSSERTVVVESIFNDMGKSQRLADVECAKYQRMARLSGPARDYMLIYDCVH